MGINKETPEDGRIDIYKRKLIVNQNCGLGRKFENAEEFENSYFRDNYYEAFVLTERIIMRNKQMEEKRHWKKYSRNKDGERLYNIITICGERGTGKTSVMDSVLEALEYDLDQYKEFVSQYGEGEKECKSFLSESCKFICLDEIDASLLEEKENILDVILSKMLKKLQQSMKNYDKKYLWEMKDVNGFSYSYSQSDIRKTFEEIYRNRHELLRRIEHPNDSAQSPGERLSDLAMSLDIREKLQKLIPMYLNVLEPGENKEKYLVISIDDLDLHANAYEMLEQIHRYLMIPQVIIYAAVSEREILSICKKHFNEIYDNPDELAMSYLEKVLPYSRRIYVPAIFNGDFNVTTGDDNKGDLNVTTDDTNKKDGLPVKYFLLGKIARRTGVFYDGCGSAMHFYEIGNLRTLLNLNYLLDDMRKTEFEELDELKGWYDFGNVVTGEAADTERAERYKKLFKKYRNILDHNFEKLKNDVINRIADEKLTDDKQREIFNEYYKEDFTSTGEYILEQIKRNILKREGGESNKSDYSYNYGELLNAFEILSREKQEFKPLLQCVLAMTTIELTQNYMYAFCESDKRNTKKWMKYIAGSICGNWGNQMLPKVETKDAEIGYVKDFEVNSFTTVIFPGKLEAYEVCKKLIEEKKLVQSFEMLVMFITKKEGLEGKENISIEISPSSENIEENTKVTITFKNRESTFDFLGFAVKSMDYEEQLKNVDEGILSALIACCKKGASEFKGDELKRTFKEMVKEHSLKNEFEKWYAIYRGMALPLYSIDIVYNVLRRAKREAEKVFPKIIAKEEVLSAMGKFYSIIGKHLYEEDQFYEMSNRGGYRRRYTEFCDAFQHVPSVFPIIYRHIKDQEENRRKEYKPQFTPELNELPELFDKLFGGLLDNMLGNRSTTEGQYNDG